MPGLSNELLRVDRNVIGNGLATSVGSYGCGPCVWDVFMASEGAWVSLLDDEISQLRMAFSSVDLREMNLLAMDKRLLRGRFPHAWARAILRGLESADSVLLNAWPGLRRHCGEVMMLAKK